MNNNKLVVPGSKQAIENLKYEVARELMFSNINWLFHFPGSIFYSRIQERGILRCLLSVSYQYKRWKIINEYKDR